jgi:hypothetical protein
VVDGRARKSYGHGKPPEDWDVLIRDHHEGYIDWAEYERNQALLRPWAGGRLHRRPAWPPTHRCDRPNLMLGLARCLGFGGSRVDAAVAAEILRVVEPMAIEAALEAERMHARAEPERRRVVELDL